MNKSKLLQLGAIVAIAAVAIYVLQPKTMPAVASEDTTEAAPAGRALASVTVPELTGNALIGEKIFNSSCKACHGPNGEGQAGVAPPFINKIYKPNHHGDEAFQRAVAQGVRSHHWRFGNMPPIEGLTRGDVKMIVAYIRQLQRANGIN